MSGCARCHCRSCNDGYENHEHYCTHGEHCVEKIGAGIIQNRDKKFDLQLSQGLQNERRLMDVFENQKLEKIELKSETHQWEQTGNICIEFAHNRKPSGIAATKADMWVHELKRDGATLMYLMIPVERLRELCRKAYLRGNFRHNSGDGGRSSVVLLKLTDLLA